MPDYPYIEFSSATEFRNWLEQNHNVCKGVRLVFYKAHTGKRTFSYQQALDEALCYGWIDSTVRRIDDEKYSQVFTPRTNIKNWSEVNKLKVLRLIKEKLMTIHGLNKIDEYVKTGKLSWKSEKPLKKETKPIEIPEFFSKALNSVPQAMDNFEKMPPSHKKFYVEWILDGKKEETRLNRTAKAVNMILNNLKPGAL